MVPTVLTELIRAAMITGLVFVMMAVVELVSVLTRGTASATVQGSPLRQYLISSFLGVTPGCAGAYLVDTMYSRGVVTLGAVTGALLATAGDEAFLMLAMFPRRALALFAGLFVVGVGGGFLTDLVLRRFRLGRCEPCLMAELHEEDIGPRQRQGGWWPVRPRTGAPGPRLALLAVLSLLLLAALAGPAEHHAASTAAAGLHAGFEGILFGGTALLGLCLVVVAPDHYVQEHLWRHLFVHHMPRIFAWTAGALVGVHVLMARTSLHSLVASHGVLLLLGASILGLIPISGPHIIVVTLFATGQAPLSILAANSIVQDGHGLLPLLGISPRDAVIAKAFNFVIGLAVGAVMMGVGW